jgi:hypothetical protein
MKQLGILILFGLSTACGSGASTGPKNANGASGSGGSGGNSGGNSNGGNGGQSSSNGGSAAGSTGGDKPTSMPEKPIPDPCIESGECPTGVWASVTPKEVELSAPLTCGNFGSYTVAVDPLKPSNMYAAINCQGIWKSTDYGLTWKGPINTGENGQAVMDTAGGLAMPHTGVEGTTTIFSTGIRGGGNGFWKSVDGGENWKNYNIAPAGPGRQDFYPAEVDPYDASHLLMVGHEQNVVVESIDGGENWTKVTLDAGMDEEGGTGAIFFIKQEDKAKTAKTWLWLAQWTGGKIGTWRTEDGGAKWEHVDANEHAHSTTQIYQPDTSGVVYMPGAYSAGGWGVIRSEDFGKTWKHVGANATETVVFGTDKKVYTMYGWAVGAGNPVDANFQFADQPGTGTWDTEKAPMQQGPGHVAVTSDGKHAIAVAGCYNSGLWRYIEP